MSAEATRKSDLTIGILLLPGLPLMSLTGIVEPLRHAGDFGDNSPVHCRWSVIGDSCAAAVGTCELLLQPDQSYLNPTAFDYLVVIGGLLTQLRNAPALRFAAFTDGVTVTA